MDSHIEPEPLSSEVVCPSMPIMNHCQQCNTELPAGARFCGKCGSPQVSEARPDKDALQNQASTLTHTTLPQSDVLPVVLPETNPGFEAPPFQLPYTPVPQYMPLPQYTPIPPQQELPTAKGKPWKMPKRWRFWTLIALLVLLVGGGAPPLILWLHTVLPAATATAMMTPTSQQLSRSYNIEAVTGMPDASQHQVATQMRLISYTTSRKSLTVTATGQGSEGVTKATGTLTFSQATGNFVILAQTFQDPSGVGLAIGADFDISPGQTITVSASAAKPGSIGNVPVDDINRTDQLSPSPGSGAPSIGTVHIENTVAFTGGRDQAYSYVQQSDIDGATTSLVNQLTPDAQAAVKQQLGADEEIADGGMQCTPGITANHRSGDRASNVTISGSVTCKAEVYNLQAARSMAADLLKSDAASQPGAHYALVGDVVTGAPQGLTVFKPGIVIMSVSAKGIWVYQFSEVQEQQLAQLIAGKPLADAQALLLKQTGVKKVSLTTAGGWGSALPTSTNDIKFTVVSVSGLQAAP